MREGKAALLARQARICTDQSSKAIGGTTRVWPSGVRRRSRVESSQADHKADFAVRHAELIPTATVAGSHDPPLLFSWCHGNNTTTTSKLMVPSWKAWRLCFHSPIPSLWRKSKNSINPHLAFLIENGYNKPTCTQSWWPNHANPTSATKTTHHKTTAYVAVGSPWRCLQLHRSRAVGSCLGIMT